MTLNWFSIALGAQFTGWGASMKKTILFVDDESNILEGLRRSLRSMRKEWDMHFALGGYEALAFLETKNVDAIISDMRMPEMDGAKLLKEVRRISPCSVRIILSGYSEEEAILRTVGPAHQYLSKPCEPDLLINTIQRAMHLRQFIDMDEISCKLSGLENLPSPPGSFTKLITILDDPLAKLDDIADILAKDLAMSAQTLKLTNSAYFSVREPVESLRKAVSLLGLDTIRSLVLVAGFFKEFSGPPEMAARIETLSQRCVSIGIAAREIANLEGLSAQEAGQSHSAGVLSHVGSLALMANWPEKFLQALELVEQEGLDIVSAETRIFGASHTQIGAYLLGLWGFTDPIAEAVAFHHDPLEFSEAGPSSVLLCVYAAQCLVIPARADADKIEMDRQILALAGKESREDAWKDAVDALNFDAVA